LNHLIGAPNFNALKQMITIEISIELVFFA
jgi:hypothetical protein